MIEPIHSISLCMGSSCFSRGNGLNAEIIQRMLDSQAIAPCETTELSGRLCEGRCREGPIVCIDGEIFTRITPAVIEDLLRSRLGPRG